MGVVFPTLVRQACEALGRAEDHARDGMHVYCVCVRQCMKVYSECV